MTDHDDTAGGLSPRYRRYALFVLFLVSTINFLDRQVLTILAQPIKQELGISDTQIGLLTGLAFGVVYCMLGIPLARLADRMNRAWVIAGSLAFWSACTVLCGRVSSYPALVAARMGVGIGEAGCTPPGMALVADYATRARRASALAFFSMGTPVGTLLGMALGGIVAGAYGWRTAFLLAGLPGLVLTVFMATLRNPTPASKGPRPARASLGEVFRLVARKRTFWLLSLGGAAKAFIAFGQQPFIAAFFLRVHGAELAQMGGQIGLKPVATVGLVLGLIAGVFGAASNWTGGWLADRYALRDIRVYATIPAAAALAAIPFFCAAMTVRSAGLAFLLLIPGSLFSGLWFGPVLAALQGISPRDMRATTTSISLFILNMVGLGFGALLVGMLSDALNKTFGLGPAEGLRWALVLSSFLGLLPAAIFWAIRRSIGRDMVD